MTYTNVAKIGDVPAGEARVYETGADSVAVFHAGDRFYACRNVCPHRGGPVGEGDFDGQVVTCPWHGWQFDVATGVNPLMPAAKLETLQVAVEGDYIQVGLP